MIDFLPDSAQQQVLDSFTEVLAREAPVSRLRRRSNGEHTDAALWRHMAGLGWLGLGLPEEQGGVALGVCEEMLLCLQAGRHLVSPALAATLVAAHAAAHAGLHELVQAITAGSAPVGLLVPLPAADVGPRCSGRFLGIELADRGWALAFCEGGVALLACDALPAGQEVPALDESLRLRAVTLEATQPQAWIPAAQSPLPLRAGVLLSALLVGAAQGARDLAVAYAGTREQFGRPIGAFQAIKHQCADMAVRVEAAQAQLSFAALALHEGREDRAFQTHAAAIVAADAGIDNGAGAVRVHGGMGFTDECEAHLFLKRAQALARIGGTQRRHLDALLRQPPPA